MTLVSLAGVAVTTGVHLAASMLRRLRFSPRSHVLSAAGGTAVAFVLVQLLPSVAHAQAAIAGGAGPGKGLRGRSLFVATLIGLLGYLAVERSVRLGLAEPPYLSRRLFWLNVNTSRAVDLDRAQLVFVLVCGRDRDRVQSVGLVAVAADNGFGGRQGQCVKHDLAGSGLLWESEPGDDFDGPLLRPGSTRSRKWRDTLK